MKDTKIEYFPVKSFEGLYELEEKNWWFESRNKIIIEHISRIIPVFENFLEVGCGTGFVLKAISEKFLGKTFYGTEYSEEGLKFARLRMPGVEFTQLDATKMDQSVCYDIIGSFDVLEHIEDDKLVLENFYTAIKPGGYLVLTVPQHMWLWSAADEYACHCRRYTRGQMAENLRNAGFQIEHTTSFISLLCPIMFLSRLRFKRTEQITDPMCELKISKSLNWFLCQIMRFEIFLLKLGIRFPIGGSLLVIAKKTL